MTAERWRRISEVFAQARLLPVAQRPAFLDAACASFPEDRGEIEDLLAHGDEGETQEQRASPLPPGRLPAGQKIGRYTVIRPLKPGGMGVLYLAEDNVHRQVVLKLVAPELAGDPRQVSRFRREAEAMARLQHPGIATLYAFEEVDGIPFLVSEFVRGRDLRERLEEEGPYEPAALLDLAITVTEALSVAHEAGIIHRDLKPENIMLPVGGGAKLVDFGIARLEPLGEGRPRTETQSLLVGTPAYMTPEQLQGGRVDHRCDLFSLGIVLYEMATGANPFSGRTRETTLLNILQLEPPPLSSRRALEFGPLEQIVARCLKKNPDLRYGSARELLADLRAARARLGESPTFVPGHTATQDVHLDRPPVWWWRFHQVVVSIVNGLLLIPLWMVRERMPAEPPRNWLFFVALGIFAMSAVWRMGSAFFVGRGWMTPVDILGPRRWLLVVVDTLYALLLIAGALVVLSSKPSLAALLLPCALGVLVVMLAIEPVTARAAFGPRRP